MKYTTQIVIKSPIATVVNLFDNPDNLKKWMKGLESFEHLNGVQGQPGAKSKLTFVIGKRKMEMIETITVRNLPQEFSGTYEANGVFNKISNKFIPISENSTQYISENDVQFSGVMKLFGWMMQGAFKKQTRTFLNDFKNFAEKE
ncbi:MAG: SRPBCC family protein [Bacteroidetes bacterium]|nr:SRPBCC family protein [Bacteroidota bacterium]